jgi:hypothetical protein
MLFPYFSVFIGRPLVSLGGRTARSLPLVPVTLIGPSGTIVDRARLDSGADDTISRDSDAIKADIDLSHAPGMIGLGVGGALSSVRYAQVRLRLTDGKEFREWPAWVGFTAAPIRQPLLGIAGCLEFFDADFRGELEEVDLRTNGLYPGT